jgi:hypothetical protein
LEGAKDHQKKKKDKEKEMEEEKKKDNIMKEEIKCWSELKKLSCRFCYEFFQQIKSEKVPPNHGRILYVKNNKTARSLKTGKFFKPHVVGYMISSIASCKIQTWSAYHCNDDMQRILMQVKNLLKAFESTFSTPSLLQNKSFNIKQTAHKGWIKAVKDTDKTYITILMKQVKVAKEDAECKWLVWNLGERKDEKKYMKGKKEKRYKRHHDDTGLCTSHGKLASLSTYSFQTPLPHMSGRNLQY